LSPFGLYPLEQPQRSTSLTAPLHAVIFGNFLKRPARYHEAEIWNPFFWEKTKSETRYHLSAWPFLLPSLIAKNVCSGSNTTPHFEHMGLKAVLKLS